MAGQDKRVIEQQATSEVFADDWFLKDSVTEGTTKISSENLKAWINDGMATEGDIETVVKNIADTYSESESYAEGDLCIHEYALFKCTGTTTGTWDSTKWQATTVAELLDSIDLSAEAISYDNTSSGLEADNVQDAIDEISNKSAEDVPYDNSDSGLESEDVQSAIDEIADVLGALKVEGTVENQSIATFTDGSALPMPKLEVGIEPVQDLHGYDNPWFGGAGKNLFNKPNLVMNKAIPQGTVIYGQIFGVTASFKLYGYDENDNEYEVMQLSINKNSTTTTMAYVRLEISQSALNALGNGNLMVSLSDFTRFEPYSNICPISGWDEVNVTRCGKNLCPTAIADNVVYKNGEYAINLSFDDGVITFETTTNISTYFLLKAFTIQPKHVGKIFTMSYSANPSLDDAQCILVLNDNGTRTNLDKTVTITSDMVGKDLTLRFYKYGIGTYVISNIQLELGTTATTYEPYNGQTYTLDLNGNRYGGKVDLVSGVMTVTHSYVDLGTVNWDKYTSSSKTYFRTSAQLSDAKKSDSPSTTHNLMCSNYKEDTWSHVIDGSGYDGNICIGWNNNAYIGIYDSRYVDASVSDFKTAMNGVQLVYELVTPLTIQLPTTVVKSLRGVNNVCADSGAILDAEYIRDMTTIINYILEQLNS